MRKFESVNCDEKTVDTFRRAKIEYIYALMIKRTDLCLQWLEKGLIFLLILWILLDAINKSYTHLLFGCIFMLVVCCFCLWTRKCLAGDAKAKNKIEGKYCVRFLPEQSIDCFPSAYVNGYYFIYKDFFHIEQGKKKKSIRINLHEHEYYFKAKEVYYVPRSDESQDYIIVREKEGFC